MSTLEYLATNTHEYFESIKMPFSLYLSLLYFSVLGELNLTYVFGDDDDDDAAIYGFGISFNKITTTKVK